MAVDTEHRPAPVRSRHSRARWIWLGVGVVGIAGLLALRFVLDGTGVALPNRLQDLLTLAFSVVIESLPFVVLGIVLSILVQVWLPPGVLERFIPRQPVLRRLTISLFGILLPVCECGNVPLARGLVLRGFTVAEAMTFLIAAPIVNPITIITTHQAFGFDDGILVARVLGGLAIANVVGWLFSLHPRQDELLTPRFAAECRTPDHDHHETQAQQEPRPVRARDQRDHARPVHRLAHRRCDPGARAA